MTDAEIRQLRNDRDYWRRRCEAMERKYGRLRGRSFLAILATRTRDGWTGETVYVEDPADAVRVSNYLHALEREIAASGGGAQA